MSVTAEKGKKIYEKGIYYFHNPQGYSGLSNNCNGGKRKRKTVDDKVSNRG